MRASRSSQRGYVQGIVIVLAVLAILGLGYARQRVISANREAGASMGYAMDQVASALTRYRKNNFLTLTSATPTVTGVVDPNAPTISELKDLKLLDGSVSNTLLGSGYATSIRKLPAGCIGPAQDCDVYSVLWLVNPVLDATTQRPNITKLSALINAVSDSAAYAGPPDPTIIKGNAGGWSLPNPDASRREGIVVVVGGLGGKYPAFLQVGDPRDPAFSGRATVAEYIKPSAGPSQTVVQGDLCPDVPIGAIKNDPSGRALSCQNVGLNKVWTSTDGGGATLSTAPLNNVPGGTSFPAPVCGTGGIPWATYSAQISAVNDTVIPPYEVLKYSVSQSGGSFVTLTEAVRPPATAVPVNGNISILGVIPLGVFSSGCKYS